VAQHTKAFHTSLDVQRGFLVGVSRKQVEFTTYIFNAGWTDPTVVLEVWLEFLNRHSRIGRVASITGANA
jgi:hypothetical protein